MRPRGIRFKVHVVWSLAIVRRHTVPLAFVLAAGGGWTGSFALAAENWPESPPTNAGAHQRESILGVGFHPGNFIGPLAFDVILRPLPHIAVDLQVGTWSYNNVHGLGVGPQVQWEFRRAWQTPYAGLAFRYEEVWSDGVKASSKGGFLVGGWQWRWQSGFGALVGGGVLYMSPVTLNAPRVGYWSSGGLYGTYEVGVRYFF
jgi:hypothetical protein